MVKARKKPAKAKKLAKAKTPVRAKKTAKKGLLPKKKAKPAKLKTKPQVKRAKKPEVLEPCEFCGVADEEAKVFTCPKCKRKGCVHCMPAGVGCMCPECEEALNAEADAKADEPPETLTGDEEDDVPVVDPTYSKTPPADDEENPKAVDAGGEGEPGSLFTPESEAAPDDDDADKENE